jgi:hypothetical protein
VSPTLLQHSPRRLTNTTVVIAASLSLPKGPIARIANAITDQSPADPSKIPQDFRPVVPARLRPYEDNGAYFIVKDRADRLRTPVGLLTGLQPNQRYKLRGADPLQGLLA